MNTNENQNQAHYFELVSQNDETVRKEFRANGDTMRTALKKALKRFAPGDTPFIRVLIGGGMFPLKAPGDTEPIVVDSDAGTQEYFPRGCKYAYELATELVRTAQTIESVFTRSDLEENE
jgi:hypothetical protein